MKIGIDVRLWNETGVGRYIRNLVKYLHIVDNENQYVLFAKSKDAVTIKSQFTNSKFQIKPADIHWHSIKEQIQFPQLLYRENLDLMHFPYFSLPIFYQKPFVVTIHDLIIYHFPTGKASTLPLPLYKMKHVGYKTVINQAVNKSRKIIVPLKAVKQDLIDTLRIKGDKIVVTHEGIDENLIFKSNKIERSLTYNKPYFLYVGNAYPHKNIDTMLRAFLRFKQEIYGKDVHLLLVGKNDFFYKSLQSNLSENNLNDIHIFHDVDDGMLSELYKHALAVITPSFMEGFGLVPLEALANECLVVASDIPAHREVCRDGAIYFNPQKAIDLFTSLQKVITLSAIDKTNLIQKGLYASKLFSWKKMAVETKALYESSLSI